MRQTQRPTIRIRIALGSAAVSALLLTALAGVITMQAETATRETATRLALNDLKPFEVDLVHHPEEEPDPSAAGVLVMVRDPDGAARRDSMPSALGAIVPTVRGVRSVTVAASRYRIVARQVRTADGVWRLWAARDLTATEALLEGVRMTVAVGVPVGVLITAVAAWLVASAALRPVERMRVTADRLRRPDAVGDLPVRGGGELRELAATLNELIEDLRERVQLERRTTADAAHELRTPLAVLSAQIELAQREPKHADLAEIRRSAERVGRLLDDLLALARAEGESAGVATVAELVTEAMGAIDRAPARRCRPAGRPGAGRHDRRAGAGPDRRTVVRSHRGEPDRERAGGEPRVDRHRPAGDRRRHADPRGRGRRERRARSVPAACLRPVLPA